MTQRRDFLKGLGATGALAALADPRAAFAAAPTDKRLVVVILRGGWDGLNVVIPYGDADYARLRANTGLKPPGTGGPDAALDLDGKFGLHPALAPLHGWYADKQLLAVHAIASPDRSRSHFDAQDTLENGARGARGLADGWLNRALVALGALDRQGLAIGVSVPLLLRGRAAVRTWAPAVLPAAEPGFLDKLDALYAKDALFQKALRDGRRSAAGAAKAMGDKKMDMAAARPNRAFPLMAEAAGKLLAAADGPRVATLAAEGWDTHVNQPAQLRQALANLAQGLVALKDNLGPVWAKTAILVVSEFGRTAAENGTRGTDHGTGGAALLLGGRVNGGRVLGRWPGLGTSALFENRDLNPTTDLRALLKSVLHGQLGLVESALEDKVFPDSRTAKTLDGLIRRG